MVKPSLTPDFANENQAMWIVFSDDTDISFLRILKKGFRHCFVIIKQADQWILIDPRANKTDIFVLPHPPGFNLPRYFLNEGKTVCKITGIVTPHKIAPLFPMSCVETVKRVIGLHKRFIFTPFGLYRHLQNIKKG
jgi:hypothetical protein